MTTLIEMVINKIQQNAEKVTGIESSPLLRDYPTTIAGLQCPCHLTVPAQGSEWHLDCRDTQVILRLTSTVYIASYEMDFYGDIFGRAVEFADNLRRSYLNSINYVNSDASRKVLLENSTVRAYIAPGIPFSWSGYRGDLNYPVRSSHFYHGFSYTFQVNAWGEGCS